MKKYKASKGAVFTHKEAQQLGRRLEQIEQTKGNSIKPKDIVEDAKNKSSPFHKYFDWKIESAANKHWLHTARNLINHIIVEVTYDGKRTDMKAFFNVNEETNGQSESVYVTVEKALTNKELRQQILQEAIREINYWKDKYERIKELSLIFNAIKKINKKIKSQSL